MNQNRRYEVRNYDFTSGELIDQSPSAISTSPTVTAGLWNVGEKGRAIYLKSATSKLDFGAVDSLGTGNITVIVLMKPDSIGATNGMVINNGKFLFGMGANKLTAASDGATYIYDAASSVPYSQNCVGAVTRTSAGVVNFFVNGVQSGTRNQASGTPAAASTNVIVGNRNASDRNFDGSLYKIIIYSTILSDQTIAQISDELMTEKSITLPAVKTVSDVSVIQDGNMEWSDASWWTGATTIAKSTTNPYKGTQCLKITLTGATGSASQTALTIGDCYRVTGKCRSDGSATPKVYLGTGTLAFTGTTSTSCQNIDVVGRCATSASVLLYVTGSAGQYVEYDDLKIVKVPSTSSYQAISNPCYIDNGGVGWNRSFANETAGQLSNSGGWNIISGSWQVENQADADKRKKQITCKSAGIASLPIPLMGYVKFDLYKGNDTNNTYVQIGATLPGSYAATGNNGYMLGLTSTEAVAMYSVASGTPTSRMVSAASYISTTGWYSIIVKRYPGGIFYTYIKGGSQFPTWTLVSVTGGSGTNPFTNNTYTTSQFLNLQFGTGDAIKNMEFGPDFNRLLINSNI
ncbi:LamG domain-containing protein [Candidatus Dojkabacteria bacterium]|jgi:hypothetical protein|nr:LamG domain-containing protein [Candidatus Dojkabacteria bacterium]